VASGEDNIKIFNFACRVGDKIKITRPLGYPPIEFTGDNYDPKYYLNGFVIKYQNLGEFEGGIDETAVYYRHKVPGRQIIEYVSNGLGQYRFQAVLEGITVHDHSSVYTGGPAFATYYAEVPGRDEET